MSQIAFPAALMLMVYITYTFLGIKHQGLGGYFRNMIPGGVPGGILVILAPVEILQYIIVRPFTLAVRLFANMFAGHMLLLIFSTGAVYLISRPPFVFGGVSFIVAVVMTGFELVIDVLQAYIIVVLTAAYIGGAVAAHGGGHDDAHETHSLEAPEPEPALAMAAHS
jgi:F-type H+-transporting ATPase subunit a